MLQGKKRWCRWKDLNLYLLHLVFVGFDVLGIAPHSLFSLSGVLNTETWNLIYGFNWLKRGHYCLCCLHSHSLSCLGAARCSCYLENTLPHEDRLEPSSFACCLWAHLASFCYTPKEDCSHDFWITAACHFGQRVGCSEQVECRQLVLGFYRRRVNYLHSSSWATYIYVTDSTELLSPSWIS